MDRTNNYNDLKPFRFWCQKVLPLVYDDSLSYYELLDKVIDYLNKTMEDVTVLNDDTEALYAAYNQLQSYVNNYFDNLDVQDEINAKLDQMAIDGTLSSLINPQIPGAVSAWLAANVNPVGSAVIVDSTLTIAGAAADAKATGDALNGKQDILTFDNTPTAGSGNPVRSFGIKTYVDGSVANVVGEVADLRDDFEGEITDLKNEINDITEVIYSKNIFSADPTNITDGKYLNPNTGNYGSNDSYMVVEDYVPVEANTQYYASSWRKNPSELAGYFGNFICFYNSNKVFISGITGNALTIPFTTPNDCAYLRVSMPNSYFNTYNLMIEKGNSATSPYVDYSETTKLKLPIITVDINGNGDFTSIKDAVNISPSGSTILVMAGEYDEQVSAWGKEMHIVGIDREACILKDTSGNYSTPPLEIGAGSIQNMSIIEEANGSGTENMGAYAIHVEDNNLFNKKLLIRNCYICSDSSSAIGMGLRGGCSVRIEDCEIICAGARASTGAAPLYFHDADAQAYWGIANLYLHNNVLRNTASTLFSMLTINSIHKENTTYMHIMYNIFVRSKTPSIPRKFNTWNTSGNTDADGWNGLSHMYLEDDSFGNNLTELNYTA